MPCFLGLHVSKTLVCSLYLLDPSQKRTSPSSSQMGMISVETFNTYIRPCTAEFVGMILFVFTGCLSVQDSIAGGQGIPFPSTVCVALASGMAITLLIVGIGHIR